MVLGNTDTDACTHAHTHAHSRRTRPDQSWSETKEHRKLRNGSRNKILVRGTDAALPPQCIHSGQSKDTEQTLIAVSVYRFCRFSWPTSVISEFTVPRTKSVRKCHPLKNQYCDPVAYVCFPPATLPIHRRCFSTPRRSGRPFNVDLLIGVCRNRCAVRQ